MADCVACSAAFGTEWLAQGGTLLVVEIVAAGLAAVTLLAEATVIVEAAAAVDPGSLARV